MKKGIVNRLEHSPTDTDRMYFYVWEEEGSKECKFGEAYVEAGRDPVDACTSRLKNGLGQRKDKFYEGKAYLYQIWDATTYASKHDRMKKHGKADDHIRERIGYRKGNTGEVHTISSEELAVEVNKIFSKEGQPLPYLKLSSAQYEMAVETINKFKTGSIILAELAARFGKTLYSSAVSYEMEVDITIITTYVKTVFTSFEADVTSFEQFKDIVHIKAEDVDYQSKIETAIKEGKKVFVYLSLCNGSKRDSRIEYLLGRPESKLIVIDEADFGAHKEGQSLPLQRSLSSNDKVLIMTGTNSDRAASTWKVEGVLSTTYFELLMNKEIAKQKLKDAA